MSDDFIIPKKINKYIERLLIDYKKRDTNLFNILKWLEMDDIKITTHEDLDYYVHELIFLLPKTCFENNISISDQQTISEKIKQDLNTVINESGEYIEEIKFDFKDEDPISFNSYIKNNFMKTEVPDFWDKDCLRIFISHSAKNYKTAKKLKELFIDSGISCFAAHKDIEPTKPWQLEIKKALNSMEVMICLITKNACESWWVNQEIGFALAQDIPIIPIKLDEHDPKGFISEIQAMSLDINDIKSSVNNIIRLIKKRFPQNFSIKKHFLNQFLKAKDGSFQRAKEKFMDIINFDFNDQEIEKIVTTIQGPAKTSINQLSVLLGDPIISKHLTKLSDKKYKDYSELLNDKILTQHKKKRYSIKNNMIIDHQETFIRDHNNTDKHNFEDVPF